MGKIQFPFALMKCYLWKNVYYKNWIVIDFYHQYRRTICVIYTKITDGWNVQLKQKWHRHIVSKETAVSAVVTFIK